MQSENVIDLPNVDVDGRRHRACTVRIEGRFTQRDRLKTSRKQSVVISL